MKVGDWPTGDRAAWLAALAPGDRLDPGGAAAGWAASTQHGVAQSYGRWLTWLATTGRLEPGESPEARVTPENLRAYIADLQQVVASSSVWGYLSSLHRGLRVMAPGEDWGWLGDTVARLHQLAKPAHDKRRLVVPVHDLFALGLQLMAAADGPDGGGMRQRAIDYRNGFIIALLAVRPLRRRNFTMIEIGRHLVRSGEHYWLRFDDSETKTHIPLEIPFPESLVPCLERYLAVYRPFLCQRQEGEKYRSCRPPGGRLWVSVSHGPMSSDAIYDCVTRLTAERFGHPVNLHLFRDCMATSVALDDPAHVRMVRSLLGHSTLATAERFYIQAQSVQAIARYQEIVAELRRPQSRSS